MLYLKNTTELQELMIPRDVNSSATAYTLEVRSTINKETRLIAVSDDGSSEHYFKIKVSIPADLVDGEYEYSLLEHRQVRSRGLLILGESARANEYNKTISYEQYIRD